MTLHLALKKVKYDIFPNYLYLKCDVLFFYFLTSDVKCTLLGDTESKKTQMIFRLTLNGMDNGDIVDQFECYSYNKFVEDETFITELISISIVVIKFFII